jgi:hypothetical protein
MLSTKKLNEITFKKISISRTTKNNKILTNPQRICTVWEEYIRDFFDDTVSVASNIFSNVSDPPIMKSEVHS